jgi:WD40 repeat protein
MRLTSTAITATISFLLSGCGSAAHSLSFSPDGAQVAAGAPSQIHLVDPVAERLLRALDLDDNLVELAYRPGESRDQVALVSGAGLTWRVRVIEASTGQQVAQLFEERQAVTALAWSPDGAWLAAATADGQVLVWEVDSAQEVARLDHSLPPSNHAGEPYRAVQALAFSWDGARLAAGGAYRERGRPEDLGATFAVAVWDTASWERRLVLGGHPYEVRALAYSPDGLLAVGARHRITVWDPRDYAAPLSQLEWNGRLVTRLGFSAQGVMASAHPDDFTRLWGPDLQLPDPRELSSEGKDAHDLCFSPAGDLLVLGHGDGRISMWDASTGRRRGDLLLE